MRPGTRCFIATLTLLTLVTAASGCEYPSDPATIRNETDQVLYLYSVAGPGGGYLEGTERERAELYPKGGEYQDREECMDEDWVVRTEDGTEFARRQDSTPGWAGSVDPDRPVDRIT